MSYINYIQPWLEKPKGLDLSEGKMTMLRGAIKEYFDRERGRLGIDLFRLRIGAEQNPDNLEYIEKATKELEEKIVQLEEAGYIFQELPNLLLYVEEELKGLYSRICRGVVITPEHKEGGTSIWRQSKWRGYNYEPNLNHWSIGDIVIHDYDQKTEDYLMKVIGFNKAGEVQTIYINQPLKRRRKKPEVWENRMTVLHDPARFGIKVLDKEGNPQRGLLPEGED